MTDTLVSALAEAEVERKEKAWKILVKSAYIVTERILKDEAQLQEYIAKYDAGEYEDILKIGSAYQ